jgi:hypothetical protein
MARPRGRSIVGPLILISLGVLLLLNTVGLVPWSVWDTLWRFWPVALILIGLELVLGRGNPWASALLIAVVLALAVPLAFFGSFFPFGWTLGTTNGPLATQNLALPLEGAREANVTLQFAAGNLYVGPSGADSGNLLDGEVVTNARTPVEIERGDEANGRANVTVRRQTAMPVNIGNNNTERWTLNVNRSLPLNLRVEGGAAEVNLDLRQLMLRSLWLEMGAANTRVQLPENAGFTQATVKGGMAELQVEVPQTVAARINARSGLSSVQVDERRFPKRGDYYQSPDYDTAANKVEINVEAGMATVRVR